jgi:hypothetical protein
MESCRLRNSNSGQTPKGYGAIEGEGGGRKKISVILPDSRIDTFLVNRVTRILKLRSEGREVTKLFAPL